MLIPVKYGYMILRTIGTIALAEYYNFVVLDDVFDFIFNRLVCVDYSDECSDEQCEYNEFDMHL